MGAPIGNRNAAGRHIMGKIKRGIYNMTHRKIKMLKGGYVMRNVRNTINKKFSWNPRKW